MLALDRAAKLWLMDTAQVLIPGVLALRPTRNTGMALGLFQGGSAVLAAVSVLLVLLCLWLMRGVRATGLGRFSLALMAGGALGNLWDRLVLGSVQDMFEFLFVDFYIFNVADAGIVIGAALCGVSLLFRPQDWRKK